MSNRIDPDPKDRRVLIRDSDGNPTWWPVLLTHCPHCGFATEIDSDLMRHRPGIWCYRCNHSIKFEEIKFTAPYPEPVAPNDGWSVGWAVLTLLAGAMACVLAWIVTR